MVVGNEIHPRKQTMNNIGMCTCGAYGCPYCWPLDLTAPWRNVVLPTIPAVAQTGWICPRCSTVNAPWVPWCQCKPVAVTVTTTSDRIGFEK